MDLYLFVQYFHVVKEIKYVTPVGYCVERRIKGANGVETVELAVFVGENGPMYSATLTSRTEAEV